MKVKSKGVLRETLVYGGRGGGGGWKKSITLLEDSLISPAHPSGRISMKTIMHEEDSRTVTAAASNKGRGILISH